MATRRERVVLDLEDNFSAGMARAAAAAALLNRQLDASSRGFASSSKSTDRLASSMTRLHTESGRVNGQLGDLGSSLPSVARHADSSGASIDKLSGRLVLFAQAASVLGPGLVPLGAAAVPVIAGLTSQLGFAALAAGVTALAFDGVGDALGALDAAQLDPTTENLAKLQQAMDGLGPAGQEFVLALDRLQPAFQQMQSLAEQGLLPGVTEGLASVMTLMPQLQSLVFETASTLGDLSADAGANLAGPKFEEFFSYLQTSARPILTELGQSFGNVFEGLATMMVAFDPLSRGFSAGLLDMSRSFAAWSDGLSQSQGFQDFLSYVESSGPLAMDAIGSIGNALVALVTAAAPVGTVVLPVVTAIADAFSALAGSSIGPTLIAAAAGISVLARSMGLLKAVGITGGAAGPQGLIGGLLGVDKAKGALASMRGLTTATDELRAAEQKRSAVGAKSRDTMLAMVPTADKRAAVTAYAKANDRVAAASAKVAAAEKTRSAAMRGSAGSFARSGAAAAGLVVATSGLGDKMGLSNTASLALMGTLAGPWGAAIGGGVGVVMDLAAANDSLESAISAANRAGSASTVSFVDQAQKLSTLRVASDEVSTSVRKAASIGASGSGVWDSLGNNYQALSDLFTHATREGEEATHKQTVAYLRLRQGAAVTFADLSKGNMSLVTASDEVVDAFVTRVSPALQQAGIDVREYFDAAGNSQLHKKGLGAIQSYFDEMSSAAGKSQAVGAALASIGHEATSAISPVDALESALDRLFGTEIDQQAATDGWAQSLADLHKQLGETKGQIVGQSQAARNNRAAFRGSASALMDKVNADAAAGVSGARLAGTLVEGREQMIQQGVAAGRTRGQMEAYVATLGLAPKNIETIITTKNVLSATQKVAALTKLYDKTPRQVRTIIAEAGANPTAAKVQSLAKRFGLLPRQIRTILAATDTASRKAAVAKTQAEKFAKLYKATLEARDGASPKAKAAQKKADAFAKAYWANLFAKDGATGKARGAESAAQKFARLYKATLNATTNAGGVAAGARSAMQIPDTSATIHINTVRTTTVRSISPANKADGGLYVGSTVAMAAGGYTDKGAFVPRQPQLRTGGGNVLWSEPETGWEAYISGKPGMEDRNRDIWRMAGERLGVQFEEFAAGGITAYAKGGHRRVTGKQARAATRQFNLEGDLGVRGLRAEFTELRRDFHLGGRAFRGLQNRAERLTTAYVAHERALEKDRERLKTLREAKAAYGAEVTTAYRHDPFGNGAAGLKVQLEADRNDARAALGYSKTLDRKGVSQALQKDLLASGDLNTLQQLSQMSASQINAYDALYAQSKAATAGLGQYAAADQYNKQIATQSRLIKRQERTLALLERKLNRIEGAVERGARRGVGDQHRAAAQRRRVGR